MMEFVREGDTVIVESISRFARNTRDLLELIEQLSAKRVEFVSRKEAIDTSTPTGKFMLTVFGAVAELEREYILQRQREGIAIAKERGVYKGRKPIERDSFDEVVAIWRRGEITAAEAMRRLDMAASTFYRKVREKLGVCRVCQSLKQLFSRILPYFTLFFVAKSPAHTAQTQNMYLNDLKPFAPFYCGCKHQYMAYPIEEGFDFD